MKGELKLEDKLRCKKCKCRYHYEESARLCCTDKGGCGKKETPDSVITSVCGETISNGKWYFCKSCQRKKQNAWRSAKLIV